MNSDQIAFRACCASIRIEIEDQERIIKRDLEKIAQAREVVKNMRAHVIDLRVKLAEFTTELEKAGE